MNKTTVLTVGGIIIAVIAAIFFITYTGTGGEDGQIVTSTSNTNPNVSIGPDNVPVATAQVPGLPFATTNETAAPTDTTAVITGTVLPMGSVTSYWYDYGTTPQLGNKTSVQVVGSGYTAIQTPGYIDGLTPNTVYYYRLMARNEFGQVNGSLSSVTTTSGTPAPSAAVPTARTLAASGIASTSATLAGQINPNDVSAKYWFEYGTTRNMGNTSAVTSVGSGTALLPASAVVSGLDSNTTYYFRINAQNQYATINGDIMTFKTR